jgi:ribonuclease R
MLVTGTLVGAGRSLAVEPAFESGPPLRLGKQGRDGRIGDLVTALDGPRGPRVVAVHGSARSPRAAMAALLASEGLGRPFPEAVLAEADAAAEQAAAEDPGRHDLTDQRVITIDPEGAKDHDDAIAVAAEGDAIRLWVHIADVARYVPFGGPIDREAARRGCSVYVPGTVDPMLAQILSNDICSLRPGAARKVVTAEMLVDAAGEVTETRFARSTIHSRRRLTYPEVDRLFAGGSLGDAALEADLDLLRTLAARLRTQRMARGALGIETAEPTFRFEGERLVGVEMEGQTEAHSLVEECMIAANEAVARYMIARGRPTIFRRHEDPQAGSIELLYERLAALGVAAPELPEGPLTPTHCAQASVRASQAVAAHTARHGGARALPVLVLRALRQAHYSAEFVGHSGLASSAYLHFTSPIRRYPDLAAHRALLDALGLGPPAADATELAIEAERSSLAERDATALERRADRICLAFLLIDVLRGDPDRIFDGEVTGIGESGAFVAYGPDLAFDGYLAARRIEGDWWRPDPLDVMLVGDDTGRRIAIGDAISVRVVDIEPLRGRVDLAPADSPRPTPGLAPRGRRQRRR